MNDRGQYDNDKNWIPCEYRTGRKANQWERMTEAERWTVRKDARDPNHGWGPQVPGYAVVIGGGLVVGLVILLRRLGAPKQAIQLPAARAVKL